VQELFEKNRAMRLCRDVCHATKHFELTQKPATGRAPSLAREYVGPGLGWFGHDSILVILSGGDKFDARELAGECLRIWEEFLGDSAAV
jgi:hypothetical protein